MFGLRIFREVVGGSHDSLLLPNSQLIVMLSEDGDSRFANLHRSRSIPTFLSEVEAVQFQLTELLTLRAADGVGVLRLRDATRFARGITTLRMTTL